MTGSTQDRIHARGVALDRLTSLTVWIGLGAVAALGVFTAVAAATIPGKASPGGDVAASSAADALPSPSPVAESRHHHSSTAISASSGQPIAVTGGSH